MNLLWIAPAFGAGLVLSDSVSFVTGRAIFALFLLAPVLFQVAGARKFATSQTIVLTMYALAHVQATFYGVVSIYQAVVDVLIVLGLILAANYYSQRMGSERAIHAVALSFLLYHIVNTTLLLIGVGEMDASQSSQIESVYSDTLRRAAPLSGSFTATSLESLVAIAAALTVVRGTSGEVKRLDSRAFSLGLGVVGLICGAVGLYYGGNRAALAGAFVVSFFYLVNVRRLLFALPVASEIRCFPFCYLLIVPVFESSVVADFAVNFSRAGFDELFSLNNRTFIWLASLVHIISDIDLFSLILGYGQYGQVASGVINKYQFIFAASHNDITKISLHSAVLQAFFNFGVVGVLVYGVIIFRVLRMLSFPRLSRLMPMFIGLLWTGTVESAIVNINIIWVVFHFILFSLLTKRPAGEK